ncbi:MAG: Glyoxalase/bleomycin resistance protein/dioxygenase [Gemmatimonadetes bacterium]|nr:Glyoxalase/bleomycin resistance protein/dioxygenase [Gemmatimonadota bacterium]
MSNDSGTPSGVAPAGFRLPAATRLGRVSLRVSDLSRSLRYYREVLGLGVLSESSGRAVLGVTESGHELVELIESPGAKALPRRGLLGIYHFAILLPDRASLGRFLVHLSDIGARAGMSDHLVSEALYLQDPDNIGIEVYADRPRGSWTWANGQLEMATNPLDTQDLVRAAGGEAWAGAPAGTTMGHVHLHVGDIPAATQFYHEGLGFDKMVWSYPGALFLAAGGYHHHLGTNTWAAHAPAATIGDAGLHEWQVVVPAASDVQAAAQSLALSGATVERDGDDALVRDPWGTRVRVRSEKTAR